MWPFGGGVSFNPSTDIPDLSGKVILVTGGNVGLGKETILQLSKHNPTIFLAARTPSKAESAILSLKSAVPNAKITFLPLDLTSFDSIRAAVKEFNSKSNRLDVLINNAGIMAVPVGQTAEGYEIQFGTNHVGHFLLTSLLLPTMLETVKLPGTDVRIVNVSSEAHNLAPGGTIAFDDLELKSKGPWARYGQSKLANILLSQELAKRYPSIKCVSVHPGLIKTDLYISQVSTNQIMKYGKMLFGPLIMQDVVQGSKNQLWAAVAKDVVSGAYYTPVGARGKRREGDEYSKVAARLWEWSEEQVKKHGGK